MINNTNAVEDAKRIQEKMEKGKINACYDINCRNIQDINDKSIDLFDIISYSFYFGYSQGERATKNELRKRGLANG